MRRSKYGYLLLALLVVTGLAGTLTPTSLNSKERKFAANNLKETKIDFLRSVRGLTEAQLNFRSARDEWSIKECIFHIAVSEKNLWAVFASAMKEPPSLQQRAQIKIADEEIDKVKNKSAEFNAAEALQAPNAPFTSVEQALEFFKKQRLDHIRYIKTTTEDLRNHISGLPIGTVDCYQLCLLMSAHSHRHIQQIEEIKAHPDFPSP